MAYDAFKGFADSPMAPAQSFFAVTPNDQVELPQTTKALYVGTGGTLVVLPALGNTLVTFVKVQDGSILDIRVRSVLATGTTAGNIVGLI